MLKTQQLLNIIAIFTVFWTKSYKETS